MSSIAAIGTLFIHLDQTCPEKTKLPVTVLLQTASLMLIAMSGVTLGKARRKLEISPALPHALNLSLLMRSAMNTRPLPASEVSPEPYLRTFHLSTQPWTLALREAVANLYNVTYRQDKTSKYTAENVCIVPGGRAGLSRVAAVVGDV